MGGGGGRGDGGGGGVVEGGGVMVAEATAAWVALPFRGPLPHQPSHSPPQPFSCWVFGGGVVVGGLLIIFS